MTNRQDIWNLLVQREGTWVNRDDLNFVGGSDAGRRMREVRDDIAASGRYLLDERKDKQGRLEFRLRPLVIEPRVVQSMTCAKCGTRAYGPTQSTIDPRWRSGHCVGCRDRHATFVVA